jgi:hypothetical protein
MARAAAAASAAIVFVFSGDRAGRDRPTSMPAQYFHSEHLGRGTAHSGKKSLAEPGRGGCVPSHIPTLSRASRKRGSLRAYWRYRLTAGGRWIRTISPATEKLSVRARHWLPRGSATSERLRIPSGKKFEAGFLQQRLRVSHRSGRRRWGTAAFRPGARRLVGPGLENLQSGT